MPEHDEQDEHQEIVAPYSTAELSLIRGDELARTGRYDEALAVYLDGLEDILTQDTAPEQLITGLLNYSIGELYRAQPRLAPDRLSALNHLVLADIDDTLGNTGLPMREPRRHGLAFCARRSMGLRDLELGISNSVDAETFIATARGHLIAAETELTRHFMALAINRNPEDTVNMQEIREMVLTADPDLQAALTYLDRVNSDRAHRALGYGRLSIRFLLSSPARPQAPDLRIPYAYASSLIKRSA